MERKIEIMSLTYVLFLGLLSAAGLLGGAISNILYFLSFLLPLLLAFILTGKEKLPALEFIKMDRHAAVSTLIFTFPTVALVLGISLLTSFVIGKLTGATNQVDLGDSLATALVLHAFLPALLEEVLFRFLPMRMLSVTSKRACILVSAFFFALVHHNLFSIPYAFAAGVIFMTLDLLCNSVIPSFIIHFLNNAISVLIIFHSGKELFLPICIGVILVLCAISLVFIIRKRDYIIEMKKIFADKYRVGINYSMVLFASICLFIAIFNLI